MLLKKSTIVLVLLVLLVGIATASASAAKADLSKNGYTVASGYNVNGAQVASSNSQFSAMTAQYSIKQGQTNWHYKTISQGCPGYVIDLNWGNSANSLQLTVYCADGTVLGPFTDGSGGRIDGRIYLYLSKSGGLPGGTYYHAVYGARVSGIQYYTF